MKLQRIIFSLEDGRRKYVTHNGEIEKWTAGEIASLRDNIEWHGLPAYTADFAKYGISAKELRERFPDARILRVTGFTTEDHDLPLDPDIIF